VYWYKFRKHLKIKKQRNLNIAEHYKGDNNNYHDYESYRTKQPNPMKPHKQKKIKKLKNKTKNCN
jgi:hypothetical protein